MNAKLKSTVPILAFRGSEDRRALMQLARSTGVYIIAASTRNQYAAEVKELGHGIFTYTLMSGLKGLAAPMLMALLFSLTLLTLMGSKDYDRGFASL